MDPPVAENQAKRHVVDANDPLPQVPTGRVEKVLGQRSENVVKCGGSAVVSSDAAEFEEILELQLPRVLPAQVPLPASISAPSLQFAFQLAPCRSCESVVDDPPKKRERT